ncbi:hypothetical protein Droror1_Dr00016578 [Drosera rotundifolia]
MHYHTTPSSPYTPQPSPFFPLFISFFLIFNFFPFFFVCIYSFSPSPPTVFLLSSTSLALISNFTKTSPKELVRLCCGCGGGCGWTAGQGSSLMTLLALWETQIGEAIAYIFLFGVSPAFSF